MEKTKMEDKFINPYHFVPLQDHKAKADFTEELKYTGKMRVKITTRTPLFIPNTSTEKAFHVDGAPEDHKSYDFFSYKELEDAKKGDPDRAPEAPVIPGSEIRGVIRNVYETLTASCMSSVDDPDIMQRGSFLFKPGLIKRSQMPNKENPEKPIQYYELFSAKSAVIKCDVSGFNDCQSIFTDNIDTTKPQYPIVKKISAGKGKNRGYLMIGEPGPTKRRAKFFYLAKSSKLIDRLDEEKMDNLEAVLNSYATSKPIDPSTKKIISRKISEKTCTYHGYDDYKRAFKAFRDTETFNTGSDYLPVYYYYPINGNKDIVYLSPACITKKKMVTALSDLLGDFNPCNDKKNLCPGCYLFGTVSDNRTDSLKQPTRLRFADAYLVSENRNGKLFLQIITLPELSSPKLSATEFYLKKPDEAVFWTYDYWTDKNNEVHPYSSETPLEIAGRKYYWHDEKWSNHLKNQDPTANNKTIRPLNKNISFEEDIYFDHISESELKRLYWICNISYDGKRGYKIGGCKPLGLGSVETTVQNVTIRSFELTTQGISYNDHTLTKEEQSCFEEPFDKVFPNCGAETKEAFDIMTEFDAVKDHVVVYPTNNINQLYTEGFKWFVDNRKNDPMGREEMVHIEKYMPPLKNGQIILTDNSVQNEVLDKRIEEKEARKKQREEQRKNNQNGNFRKKGGYRKNK